VVCWATSPSSESAGVGPRFASTSSDRFYGSIPELIEIINLAQTVRAQYCATRHAIAERESRGIMNNIRLLDVIASSPAPIKTTM